MDALILSCSTGGGHNAAANAIKEELISRGHNAVMLDPYELADTGLEGRVGSAYVKIAQASPRAFGMIYKLGDAYRRLPIHSPVYWLNMQMLPLMKQYLEENHFDIIITTHVFPGEILTYMKARGIPVPPMVFVATDYVCIPFTEECDYDCFCIPSAALTGDFIGRGIPEERIYPTGIPVRREFQTKLTRSQAAKALGLDESRRYILMSGGSIGAGQMRGSIHSLSMCLKQRPEYSLIVICGNNRKLYEDLSAEYSEDSQITLLTTTDKISLYMRASDVYLSKPGGLSSTEAAVMGVPLIHLPPIPGCETRNRDFFASRGMCLPAGETEEELIDALERLQDADMRCRMRENQRKYISPTAAADICRLSEMLASSGGFERVHRVPYRMVGEIL